MSGTWRGPDAWLRRCGALFAAIVVGALSTHPVAPLLAQEPAAGGDSTDLPEPLAIDTVVLPALWAEVGRALEDPGLARSVETLLPDRELVPFRDLGQWLSSRSSAVIRRYGGGGRQVLSLRGGRSEGVLVLLDGLPVNDPLTGEADLSTVPLNTLESATLVRGAGGARFGSGALGGALVLRSTTADRTESSVRLGAGSYGAYEVTGAVSARGLRLGVGLRGATNDYAYVNRLAAGSPEQRRENADSETRWLHLGGTMAGRYRLGLRYDELDRGVPGRLGTNAFAGDRWKQSRWSLTSSTAGERAALRAGARKLSMRYTPGDAGQPSAQEALDVRMSGEMTVPALKDVVVAGRLSLERLSGEGIRGTPDRHSAGVTIRRTLGAGGTGTSGTGTGERGFGAEPVLAFDVSGGETAFSPELGAWYRFGGGARVFGRVGRAFRLPTFADQHFSAAPGVRARPDLEAERVVLDAELGLAAGRRLGRATAAVRLAAWTRDTRRPIVWLASSAALWSPRNLDRLRAHGFDLELRLGTEAGSSGWAIETGVSLQDSRVGFGSNRNPLPYQPDVTGRLSAEIRRGATAGRVGAVYTGSRTTSLAATRRLDDFITFEVGVTRRFTPGGVAVDAALDVENVLDADYELVELFPEPGRTIRLTLDIH